MNNKWAEKEVCVRATEECVGGWFVHPVSVGQPSPLLLFRGGNVERRGFHGGTAMELLWLRMAQAVQYCQLMVRDSLSQSW